MKKTRRSQVKYPALNPKMNLKIRQEQLDYDYINKLPAEWIDPHTNKKWTNDQLKEYLNNFSNEFILTDFRNPTRVHKKVKAENEKNKPLKQLILDLNIKIKEFIELINKTNISPKIKNKLKKSTNEYKKTLKKQIKDSFGYIEDYYKKESEDKNNSRNRCIMTRKKVNGDILGIDDLNPYLTDTKDIENQLIDQIDNQSEDE